MRRARRVSRHARRRGPPIRPICHRPRRRYSRTRNEWEGLNVSDDMLEMRAQMLALRQFAVGHYASILVARPGPVTAALSLAQSSVAGFEKALAAGAVPDASGELVQASIHQLELIWNDVEQ